MGHRFTMDPDATLDFSWDWSNWLADGETILTAFVAVPVGLTKESETNDDTGVTVWLSADEAGQSHTVTCSINTSDGRTDERSIVIDVKQR